MNPIFTRPAKPEDVKLFLEWSKSDPDIDPEAIKYSDSFTLVAYDTAGILAFMPVQSPQVFVSKTEPNCQPFMLESIAFKPGLSNLGCANVMREFIQSLVLLGHLKGVGEIYFMSNHDNTGKFAGNHVFRKMEWPLYRLKLSDLEGKDENNP